MRAYFSLSLSTYQTSSQFLTIPFSKRTGSKKLVILSWKALKHLSLVSWTNSTTRSRLLISSFVICINFTIRAQTVKSTRSNASILSYLDVFLEDVTVEQTSQSSIAVVRVRELIIEILVERGHNWLAVDVNQLSGVECLVLLVVWTGLLLQLLHIQALHHWLNTVVLWRGWCVLVHFWSNKLDWAI